MRFLPSRLDLRRLGPGLRSRDWSLGRSNMPELVDKCRQAADKRGTIHLRGVNSVTGKPFDLTVTSAGYVEGTLGDQDLTFTIAQTSSTHRAGGSGPYCSGRCQRA